jgi:HK97 gp10 family phage protein
MASLRVAVAALVVETEADLWRLALNIQNYARLVAPVDTGRLRSSIFVRRGDGYVEVGSNVQYAAYVEFGTRHMAAQPYLRPAIMMGVEDWASGGMT